jgi:hypothetical protein
MSEHIGEGSSGGLAHVHEALFAAYAEVLASPSGQVEGLDRAACGPHVKHLAELAAVAAADGMSPNQWRTDVLAHAGPSSLIALDSAEACMRESGLWPWNSPDTPQPV